MSFFFSSRRRHTRFDCDWSSDVCSSDLYKGPDGQPAPLLSLLESKFGFLKSPDHGDFLSTTIGLCIGWTKDRKSTRLNSSHSQISYAVFCLKKKTITIITNLQRTSTCMV